MNLILPSSASKTIDPATSSVRSPEDKSISVPSIVILSTLTPPSNVPVGASKSTLAVIFVPECTYRIFAVVPLSPKFNPLPSSAALSVLPLATVIVDAETTNSAFEAAVCSKKA